jgi:fructosamine-3-kinase
MIGGHAAEALGVGVSEAARLGGGDICEARRLVLRDGRLVFAKHLAEAPPGFFASEAAGLRWLGETGVVAVPEVLAVADDLLVLSWIEPGAPTPDGAERLGRALARLHGTGAPAFGASWPGFVGPLPMDNTPADGWPAFFAERRVRPYLRSARDRGAVGGSEAEAIERALDRIEDLAGPPEPPGRIHGDLWSGNVHWDAQGTGWLIDPAAHGGHRESDLAMLALFGAPLLDRILTAYQEERPLAEGWRDRQPLHQLHPLLVHATLFGGGYGAAAGKAARRLV